MANPEQLAILKQGVEQWNQWREQNSEIEPDLTGVSLVSTNLSGARLGRANLGGANLTHANLRAAELVEAKLIGVKLLAADLTNANLRAADLKGASLRKAKLIRADLSSASLDYTWVVQPGAPIGKAYPTDLAEADLTATNLSHAELRGTNLSGANLAGTIFSGARVSGAHFDEVDLSAATGLETMKHGGPSTIGTDTIYKSRGRIPEIFLRGCGVPEDLVGYIRSIAGAIQYYSCFISYSTKDQAFADRLYADLQSKGVRCWFAPHDIMGGRKIHEQIDAAIRVHDKLLLILSAHSMASDWVGTEIANAHQREAREKKQMLFPITIAPFEEVKQWKKFDADRGTDSAREIREYYIPDFSGWERDHAGYQREFEKLVGALKAVGE
jgi:hypothetical protein